MPPTSYILELASVEKLQDICMGFALSSQKYANGKLRLQRSALGQALTNDWLANDGQSTPSGSHLASISDEALQRFTIISVATYVMVVVTEPLVSGFLHWALLEKENYRICSTQICEKEAISRGKEGAS